VDLIGLSGGVGSALGLLGVVDHHWAQDAEIEGASTASLRELEPENEEGLEGIVEWKVIENWSQGDGFEEVEETEDDPVCEPLDIIFVTRAFDSLEGEISGKSPANEVGNWRSECVDEDEKGENEDASKDKEGLGDLGAGFEIVKDRVLVQLLVELRVVVLSLAL
jgi:hypothetical protein